MLVLGEINKLKVLRKTDIGYMLQNESFEEVFLHNNETNHRLLSDDEIVDAYLYFDAKGRMAATLSTPFVTMSKPGFLQVKAKNEGLGVFLDNNISKDILLSIDDLPADTSLWPQDGDYLYVYLKVKGKMVAKRATRSELTPYPLVPLVVGETCKAFVYRIVDVGISLVSENLHQIFIHKHNLRKNYRLGEAVDILIINYNGDTYNGTTIAKKENQLHDDANHILVYLIKNDGIMALDANSSPENIEEKLNLSKKAFKRGIGNLYKQRIIDFNDGNTVLLKKDEEK